MTNKQIDAEITRLQNLVTKLKNAYDNCGLFQSYEKSSLASYRSSVEGSIKALQAFKYGQMSVNTSHITSYLNDLNR